MNALMASELGVWSVHRCLNVPVHEKLHDRTTGPWEPGVPLHLPRGSEGWGCIDAYCASGLLSFHVPQPSLLGGGHRYMCGESMTAMFPHPKIYSKPLRTS